MLHVTVNEYLAELRQTKHRRIIVEGTDDKVAIEKLIHRYFRAKNQTSELIIDSAERIREQGLPLHNGKRIIEVINRVRNMPEEHKIVGLIDREFVGLVYDRDIIEENNRHIIEGRLVRTRGHSLENYFFDIRLIDEVVRTHASQYPKEALRKFNQMFDRAIRLASAISLAGQKIGEVYGPQNNFKLLEASFSSIHVELKPDGLDIDIERWREGLSKRYTKTINVDELLSLFQHYLSVLQDVPLEVCRWLCHGHIGMHFLSLALDHCVEITYSEVKQDLKKMLNTDHDIKFNIIANTWARLAIDEGLEHPSPIFELVDSH